MEKDNTMSDHGLDKEKIIGYKYKVNLGRIKISNSSINLNINCKRNILTPLSSIFDPLGLCFPVTVKDKFIMKNLLSKNLQWDQQDDSSIKNNWSKFVGNDV